VVRPLVGQDTALRVLVPPDNSLGDAWTGEAPFDDSLWEMGHTSVGYETDSGSGEPIDVRINFQLDGAEVPPGYLPDVGDTFRDHGSGFSYGWNFPNYRGRDRNNHPDQRYDTLNHMQQIGTGIWEIALPNGQYDVWAVFGDPSYTNQVNTIDIEGVVMTDPDGQDHFDEYHLAVTVTDGRLTIAPGPGASNAKIAFLEISSQGDPTYGSLIGTDVEVLMRGVSASAYVRMPFALGDPAGITSLTLRMRYDDGFEAYLNGIEIASRNAPDPAGYDSAATADRHGSEAVVYEEIDVSAYIGDLNVGENVLAIHGLNDAADSADFLIMPQLAERIVQSWVEHYFATPSPSQPNSEDYWARVADTAFDVDRGYYDQPFRVAITTETPDAEIYYTTDGSRPTPAGGTLYTEPVYVDTTTTLRAAAYKDGHVPTNIDTQTYIFPEAVARQVRPAGYPTSWGGEPNADYEMDQAYTLSAQYYDRFIAGLTDIPTMSLVLPAADFFGGSGLYSNPGSTTLEKETSAELFYPDGREGFQLDAGLKIQGGASRNPSKAIKHSMSLRFRGVYGEGRLEFPMFAGSDVDEFNSLQLRAMYNNSWIHWDQGQRDRGSMIRDQWMREALIDMGQADAGEGDYVHLYVNGLYWGVYNVHERQEGSHYAAHNGVADEDTVDALNSGSAIDGTSSSWSALHNQVAAAVSGGISLAEYQAIEQNLDVVGLIDYMIVNHYGANSDWDGHNWRAAGGGPDGLPWHIYSWDAERVLEGTGTNRIGVNNSGKPSRLFHNLRSSGEFVLLYADRLHKHLFNGGALTPTAAAGRWMKYANLLDRAIIAESARWGDDRPGGPYERDIKWISEQNRLIGSYFPVRTANLLSQYRSAGLYCDVEAPGFSRHGGSIDPGFSLSMSTSASTIYYTLDGSDPRMPGGAISPKAILYTGSVPLGGSTLVRARAMAGGEWSALNEAVFESTAAPPLAVTELHYHPYAPTAEEMAAGFIYSDDFEFIEIRNVGAEPVNLSTIRFVDGVQFSFAEGSIGSLLPGDFALAVANRAAFEYRYGESLPVAGEYAGLFRNAGERVALAHGTAAVFFDFTYADGGAWPGRPDGRGSSLELIDPAGDVADDDNWRPSATFNGTPGAEGIAPTLGVVVNEVLTHTDPPQIDTIELYNAGATLADLGGWYLSDAADDYYKYRIPDGTTLAPGRYMLIDEGSFNPSGGVDPDDFALSGAHGDDVWLLTAEPDGTLGRFVDHAEFGAAANGESWGRWPDPAGDLYPMTDWTPRLPNSGPRVGPLVISEIQYNPGAFLDPNDLEFIEVHNPTDEGVDLTGWHLAGGVGYDFAAGTQIPAGSALVVLSFNPADPANAIKLADFRSAYGIDASVPLVGGYSGSLDNGGEAVRLERPDEPPAEEPFFLPRLLEDEIDYDEMAPWPVEADGTGLSLHRLDPALWGNDPASWQAAAPTPGSAAVDATPPAVDCVLVASSTWGAAFLAELGGVGYALPTGASQLDVLPWLALDQVIIVFSEDALVVQEDLALYGVSVAQYATSGFRYDADSQTATWTLSAPLAADKLLLSLADTVTDAAGNALDGEWADGISMCGSGDGQAGGDFVYRLNVLPGDVDQNGEVRSSDVIKVRRRGNTAWGDPEYSPHSDVDGSGEIRSSDVIKVRRLGNTALPSGEPTPPPAGGGAGDVDALLAAAASPLPALPTAEAAAEDTAAAQSPTAVALESPAPSPTSVSVPRLTESAGDSGAASVLLDSALVDALRGEAEQTSLSTLTVPPPGAQIDSPFEQQ